MVLLQHHSKEINFKSMLADRVFVKDALKMQMELHTLLYLLKSSAMIYE